MGQKGGQLLTHPAAGVKAVATVESMTVALEALKGRSPRIEAIRKQVAQLLARQTSARHLPAILLLG